MRKTDTPSTDVRYERFAQGVYRQITEHGVVVGYHPIEGSNTLFEFVKSFDPRYRHPIGEAISKLKELAQQIDSGGPIVDCLENLMKASAWVFLIYDDMERSRFGPTQNRTGRRAYIKRTRRGPGRPKLPRNARKSR